MKRTASFSQERDPFPPPNHPHQGAAVEGREVQGAWARGRGRGPGGGETRDLPLFIVVRLPFVIRPPSSALPPVTPAAPLA